MEFRSPTLEGAIKKATAAYKTPKVKPASKPNSAAKRRVEEPSIPEQSPTQQRIGAIQDFTRNFQNMRDANTRGADKYFHCVANCQATRRGPIGEQVARQLSNAREWSQWVENHFGDGDEAADRAANQRGRNGARGNPGVSCHQVCRTEAPSWLSSRWYAD